MATRHKVALGTEQGELLAGSGNMHFCDDLLTLEQRETLAANSECMSCTDYKCAPFILPRTRMSQELTRKKAAAVEFAVYAFIVTTVIYSVVMNSFPVLMLAIILAGSYIVLSHFYRQAVEVRNRAEARNYMNLISPGIERN